jgi:CheY-like chemotaxis protein
LKAQPYNGIDMANSLLSKILLIDSEPQFVYLMKRYADYAGCLLIQTELITDIVDLVEKENPSIIFLSISHTETDYSGLLQMLKSRVSTMKIPIVVCSSSDVAQQDWTHEVDACLIQPIMYSDFTRIISELGLEIMAQKGRSEKGGHPAKKRT